MPAPEPISDAGLEQLLEQFRNASDNDLALGAVVSPPSAIRWLATLDQQTRRIAAVRALHISDNDPGNEWCWNCGASYPCRTIRALDTIADAS